jgi:hypothetical protein
MRATRVRFLLALVLQVAQRAVCQQAAAELGVSVLADRVHISEMDALLAANAKLPRSGVGIIYFVYFGDDQRKAGETFIYLAKASAQTYRKRSPSLQIAIATTHPDMVPNDGSFTHVFLIPKEVLFAGRQWLTRVYSLALTPFELTLAVDSDTLACGDLTEPLMQLLAADSVDLAASGHHPPNVLVDWFPDAGVILYRWTPGFRALRVEWLVEQIKLERHSESKDDQGTLQRAVYRMHRSGDRYARVGRLTTAMSCRLRPAPDAHADGVWQWNRQDNWHTMLLSTKIYVLHMNGAVFFYDDICQLVNEAPLRARVMTYDNRQDPTLPNKNLRLEPFHVAYSRAECEEQLGAGNCSSEVIWATDSHLVERL